MVKNRFSLHIKWYNYEKTDGEAELRDNGQPLLISEDVEDMRCVKDLLNELYDLVLGKDKLRMELSKENDNLKHELLLKEDLIQQLKIKLSEDYYQKWKKLLQEYTNVCEDLAEMNMDYKKLSEENEQLKQFPVKLDNRIQKLEESLKALREMEDDDLNPQAVEDVATVIGISLNALMEFRKELKGDVE